MKLFILQASSVVLGERGVGTNWTASMPLPIANRAQNSESRKGSVRKRVLEHLSVVSFMCNSIVCDNRVVIYGILLIPFEQQFIQNHLNKNEF